MIRVGRVREVFAILAFGLFFHSPALHAEEITIDKIEEGMRQWRSQFANLRLVYHQTSPEQLQPRFPDLSPEQLEGYYHRIEFVWTDHGPGRMDQSRFENNKLVSRWAKFTNGKLVFGVKYGEGAEKAASTVEAEIGVPRFKPQSSLYGVMPLTHVWYGSDQWLYELLEEHKAKVLRRDTLDGVECVVIETHPRASTKKTFWLDPNRNFLPRKVVAHDAKYSPGTFEVQEFQEAAPGVWFPSRGRQQPPAEPTWTLWKVTELEVNGSLPPTLFELPPLSPGTYVIDGVPNRQYRFGKDAPQTAAAKPAAASAPPGTLQPITAPAPSDRTPIYLAVTALLLAALGVALHFFRQKQ